MRCFLKTIFVLALVFNVACLSTDSNQSVKDEVEVQKDEPRSEELGPKEGGVGGVTTVNNPPLQPIEGALFIEPMDVSPFLFTYNSDVFVIQSQQQDNLQKIVRGSLHSVVQWSHPDLYIQTVQPKVNYMAFNDQRQAMVIFSDDVVLDDTTCGVAFFDELINETYCFPLPANEVNSQPVFASNQDAYVLVGYDFYKFDAETKEFSLIHTSSAHVMSWEIVGDQLLFSTQDTIEKVNADGDHHVFELAASLPTGNLTTINDNQLIYTRKISTITITKVLSFDESGFLSEETWATPLGYSNFKISDAGEIFAQRGNSIYKLTGPHQADLIVSFADLDSYELNGNHIYVAGQLSTHGTYSIYEKDLSPGQVGAVIDLLPGADILVNHMLLKNGFLYFDAEAMSSFGTTFTAGGLYLAEFHLNSNTLTLVDYLNAPLVNLLSN